MNKTINITLTDGQTLKGTPVEAVEQWKGRAWDAGELSLAAFIEQKADVFGLKVDGKTDIEKCESFLDAMVAGGFAQEATQ